MTIILRRQANLLSHIIGWLLLSFVVLFYHPLTWGITLPIRFWLKQILLLGMLMGVFYFNIYFLIPKLLSKKERFWYVISVIVLILLSTLLNNYANLVFNIYGLIENRPTRISQKNFGLAYDTYIPTVMLLLIGFGTTISFIKKWQEEVNLRQQLEQENIKSALTLLKAQINPHFFFNTLNNIYSYTLSDGDVARTAITNLSKMMRYVLYDTESGLTPLTKEMAFISDYIDLMRLRLSAKTKIDYDAPTQINGHMIAPMLFLPLIENAFKHGVSNIIEGTITIKVFQSPNSIVLTVTNPYYEAKRFNEDKSNGIGLLNTTKRLELLYPGKYTLITGLINKSLYEAKLTLML